MSRTFGQRQADHGRPGLDRRGGPRAAPRAARAARPRVPRRGGRRRAPRARRPARGRWRTPPRRGRSRARAARGGRAGRGRARRSPRARGARPARPSTAWPSPPGGRARRPACRRRRGTGAPRRARCAPRRARARRAARSAAGPSAGTARAAGSRGSRAASRALVRGSSMWTGYLSTCKLDRMPVRNPCRVIRVGTKTWPSASPPPTPAASCSPSTSRCRPAAARPRCTGTRPVEVYRVLEGEFAFYLDDDAHGAARRRGRPHRRRPRAHDPQRVGRARPRVRHVPRRRGGDGGVHARAADAASIDEVMQAATRHGIEITRPLP